MKHYLIVNDGPCALSRESTDRELVYTTDPGMALAFSTRDMAANSPWFCVGDVVMPFDEFEARLLAAS